MENENLLDRIRELLKDPDQKDHDWNPEKYWDMYTARKRKPQVWRWTSYASAAMLLFTVVYMLLSVNLWDFQRNTSSMSEISQKTPVKKNSYPKLKENTVLTGHKISHNVITKAKKNTVTTSRKRYTRKTQPIPDEVFAASQTPSISALEKESVPSLMQMWEQGKHERELRTLNVTLDDRSNYRRLRLMINQQMLANKFNGEVEPLNHDIQRNYFDSNRN